MPKPSRLNPGRPPRAQKQTKTSDPGSSAAELTAIQDALDSTTKENRRIASELESRQEAHEQALKAKEDALAAAEEKILRIEKELSETKVAGAKTGDNTYDELVVMRESVQEECEQLRTDVQSLTAELAAEKESYQTLDKVFVEKLHYIERQDEQLATLTEDMNKLKKSKTKAEEDLAKALADLSADSGSTVEVDSLKRRIAELAQECEKLEHKLAKETSAAIELQQKLDELKDRFDGKTPVDSGHFKTFQIILRELNALDPEKLGADSLIVKRINDMITELKADLAQAKSELARAGSGDHDTCNNEINRLEARCVELDRMKNHEAALKDESNDNLQKAVADLDSVRQNLDDWKKHADKVTSEREDLHQTLKRLDPDPDATLDGREQRIREALENTDQSASPTTHKNPFKEPLVLLALVGMLIAGAFASYMFVTRGMNNSSLGASAATSASASANAEAPEGEVSNTLEGKAVDAEEEPATETAEANEAPAAVMLPETCYPVDANVIALFFGQELRDGKIHGQVPQLEAGKKRIKCATAPVYDAASKLTDISGCEACVPGGPGIYKAEGYMKNLSAQIDPSCYTEPYDYKFHMWPSGQSIRFSCDTLAPYDPVRNCRDVRGCNVIVPDPNMVKCSTCGQ